MGQVYAPTLPASLPPAIIINPVNVTGAEPRVIFTETGVAADFGKWDFDVNAGVFALRTRTDADGAGVSLITATRDPGATSVSTIEMRATSADGSFARLIVTPSTSNIEGANATTLNANGGDTNLFSGAGNGTGTGGDFSIQAGDGGATGQGGPGNVSAGSGGATSGNGGTLTLGGGAATDGNGGSVTIAARNGTGTNRSGGSVVISSGNNTGTGTRGNVSVVAGGGAGGVYTFDATNNRLNVATADIRISSAGRGLRVSEGANGKQGTAVLVAGTLVVANTSITANSRIFLTSQADGGAPGFVRVSARVVGTSFTILSSSATDTSTIAFEIFEPA